MALWLPFSLQLCTSLLISMLGIRMCVCVDQTSNKRSLMRAAVEAKLLSCKLCRRIGKDQHQYKRTPTSMSLDQSSY